MDVFEAMQIVADFPEIFGACVFVAWLPLFIIYGFSCICDLLREIFSHRVQSSRCTGFHNGTMTGVCRCHQCYYAQQCSYYAPRRTFTQWLRDLRKKKEP